MVLKKLFISTPHVTSVLLSLAILIVGALGYAYRPPSNYMGSGRAFQSMFYYYSALSLFLLVRALKDFIYVPDVLYKIFAFPVFLIPLCGLRYLVRVWNFDFRRFTDCLVYGSIIYLMNDCIAKVDVNALVLLSALMLAVASFMVMVRVKLVVFENYELVSIIYFMTFLIGLCLIGKETLPFILALVLNCYVLYIIAVRYVEPMRRFIL